MKYYHLGKEKRDLIDKKYNQERLSITEIAKHLGVSKSTISREIKRNSVNLDIRITQKLII